VPYNSGTKFSVKVPKEIVVRFYDELREFKKTAEFRNLIKKALGIDLPTDSLICSPDYQDLMFK